MLLRKSSIVTSIVGFFYVIILCFVYLDLVISEEAFYKKFHQTEYKIKFEGESLVYVNKSYAEMSHALFKYNRTNFAANTTLTLNIDMGNDLEIIVQMYKFLSNEYRIFPVHFEYNFCKSLHNNMGGIKDSAQKCGSMSCPLKKNVKYYLCNCVMDETKLPPLIPTGRFKLALEGRYENQLVFISESYVLIYLPIIPGRRVG